MESGGFLVQPPHSSPLTLHSLFSSFLHHPSVCLSRGRRSINNLPLPQPHPSRACVCARVCVLICLHYTQRSLMCVQVPQLVWVGVCNCSTFQTVCVFVCVHYDRESNVHGVSDMTHHISRCPCGPPRPVSPPYFYHFFLNLFACVSALPHPG